MNVTLIEDTAEPLVLFRRWFAEACAAERLAEAMSLATTTRDARPSVRMVLLKQADERGFVFYTNADSRKGDEIEANPRGALCLYWKTLGRQVRAEGPLTRVSEAEADAYFGSRPRDARISAWASDQSRVLPERAVLVDRIKDMEARFAGQDVARPPHWTGFRMAPEAIEFWQDVPNRLHDRLLFRRKAGGWDRERLYP
jgi:pyridoxamine 5'-phosphate oxidase